MSIASLRCWRDLEGNACQCAALRQVGVEFQGDHLIPSSFRLAKFSKIYYWTICTPEKKHGARKKKHMSRSGKSLLPPAHVCGYMLLFQITKTSLPGGSLLPQVYLATMPGDPNCKNVVAEWCVLAAETRGALDQRGSFLVGRSVTSGFVNGIDLSCDVLSGKRCAPPKNAYFR